MDTIQIKHKRAIQHTEEQRVLTCQITINFVRHANHFFLNLLFLSVLNGSFMFNADLLKHITIPCEISCSLIETVNSLSFI